MNKEISLQKIKIKTVLGLQVLLVREFFMKAAAVIGQLALVKILLPEAFGIFAIATFLVSAAEIFTDVGLSSAIIQKKDKITKEQLSAIFFIKLFLSIMVFLIFYEIAPFFKLFYHSLTNDNIMMFKFLALTLLLKPFDTILTALFERDLEYNIISIMDLIGIAFYYLSAIFLGSKGFSAWSFVWAVIIKECAELCLSFYFKPWFPIISIKLSHFKEIKNMMKFGIYMQMGSLLGFIQSATTPVIAGIFSNTAAVGFLDWSGNIATLPKSLSDNFGRVAFASFAKIQNQKKLIALSIEKSFGLLSIISIYVILITLGFGSDIIRFFISDKWLPTFPALCWFVASTFFLNGTSALGHGILAIGKTKIMFISSFLLILSEYILSYLFLTKFGFIGIAMASFTISLLMFLTYIFIGRIVGLHVNLVKMIIPKLTVFIISLFFVFIVNIFFNHSFNLIFIKIIFTTIIYFAVCYFLSQDELKKLFTLILLYLKR